MVLGSDQRRMLGAFVRARREALEPPVPGARRRTPGLRREEMAQRCGFSTTWYTWIEQGREISLSLAAWARLADALELTSAERAYFFELSHLRDPKAPTIALMPPTVPPELVSVLEATSAPAYLLDGLWSARAWNAAAAHLFAPWFGSGQPSLLRYVFLDPSARGFVCDWDERAARILAEFRADLASRPDETGLEEMIADLRRESSYFSRLWAGHTVLTREGGLRSFEHPVNGRLHYQQMTLVPVAHRGYKIVVLLRA